jgi:hypothetical protein
MGEIHAMLCRTVARGAAADASRAIQLQRKHACGGAAGKDEMCDDCKAEALQRKALEFGIDTRVNKKWENVGIIATKPGERPFTYVEGHQEQGVTELAGKTTLKKSMKALLDEAPIGSKVVWSNVDALAQCNKSSWTLSFCNYANENTVKVGQNQYAAHPFGVVNDGLHQAGNGASAVPRQADPARIHRQEHLRLQHPPSEEARRRDHLSERLP